ncbi:hypothetical protein FA13DRAFT_1077991 [Coprinellus micaceus]|uniref:Uncharacterized protein n=1 Tax=Coprinellus micaceus TaxID=71717 RepID=A0A4Y7TR74_COPMI|nr:hypothetical protein FA13DRAFT_1077991 [Coprinellus micaceus]
MKHPATRIAARQHRTPRTQIFVPRKLPPLSGLPTRSATYAKGNENKRKAATPHWNTREAHSTPAPSLPTHGSLSSIMVSKKPFKEVRFGPLPTSIRRYPPVPSETSEDESSSGVEEDEYTASRYAYKPTTIHRSLPRSPWVPNLNGGAMDAHNGDSWKFISACSKYPPFIREPLSTRFPNITSAPAQPTIAPSSLKYSSSACNPLLPLLRLPASESTPNMIPSSPSTMAQETPQRKHSFYASISEPYHVLFHPRERW